MRARLRRSWLPRGGVATLPVALLQSAQYALAKNAVLRPAWFVTRLGEGRAGRAGIMEEEEDE